MKLPTLYISIASGCLFGVSFVIPFLWWCFLPAFVLFIHLIGKEDSLKRMFFFGWLVGTLHYAGSFFWVWSSFPIMWMQDGSVALQLGAILYYWVVTSAVVGLGGGIVSVVIKKICKSNWMLIAFVPLAWVFSEILKSLFFSIYTFGDGSFLSAGFSYGYLGYLLSENPLTLRLASIAGVYGLSYVAALIGVVTYIAISKRLYTQKPFVVAGIVCVVLAVSLSLVPMAESEKNGKEVISLEAHFDRDYLAQENARTLKNAEVNEAMAQALKQGVDVIVAPEDVRWSDSFETTSELFAWMKKQTDSRDVVIIDNGPALDARGEHVIRAYMYDLRTESIYFFDKKYLVPQGEFFSYIHQLALSILMSKEEQKEIVETTHFKAGVLSDSELLPGHLPGVLFCFETMVPYGVKKAASYRNPDLIVHPISHAWFSKPLSFSLEYQLNSMLKVHAVWNRIPIVTSGSMTESKMYLPSGKVEKGEIINTTEHTILKKFSL